MPSIIPAVLPSSRDDLEAKLAFFATLPHISRVQIDVVDGRFAAPASWPYTAPEEFYGASDEVGLLPHADRFDYEMDLMCLDAERAADAWLDAGASHLTFHVEALLDPARQIAQVQERHGREIITYGIALNIATELARVEPVLPMVGYVQFMGIATIGKQAQPFDTRVLEKIRAFKVMHPDVRIQVDGGVSLDSAPALLALGVSDLVAGSAIIKAADPVAMVEKLESLPIPKRA